MPGPKTRSTKKNTAPKGVAPKVPTNENLLFPGIGYPTTQPRNVTVTWPQFGSNPADRGYLEPYDPITGLPTGQTPVSPYIPQFPGFPTYGPPLPPSTTAQPTATPTTPTTGVVDNTNPEMRYFNPYLQTAPEGYAPSMTTGNPPAVVPEWNPQKDPYAWERDKYGNLVDGMYPASALPEGWTSTYSPEAYMWNPELGIYGEFSQLNPLTAIWGGGSRGTMGTRGWRRPGISYIPDQRVTRAGPGGPITAERPPKPSRRGDNDHTGNNQNLSIPAWVGPLVSWRT